MDEIYVPLPCEGMLAATLVLMIDSGQSRFEAQFLSRTESFFLDRFSGLGTVS